MGILRETMLFKYWNQAFPKRNAFNGYARFYYLFGDSGFKLPSDKVHRRHARL